MAKRVAKTPEELANLLRSKILEAAMRGAGKGLDAVRAFLTARVKETMSVPAPRKIVKTVSGERYYRATMPATPGAPIRKLSGRARSSVASHKVDARSFVISVNARGMPSKSEPAGFPYPRYHEVVIPGSPGSGKHAFVQPTVEKYQSEMNVIMGKKIRLEFGEQQ